MWYIKKRRAQSVEDFETWEEGGVTPTLNVMDNTGDTRATVLVVRMREGKPGGGKGPLMSEDKSLTLGTGNDQIIFYGNRVDDVRVQGDVINTLAARMGTGGNNMPLVAYPIQDGREINKAQNGLGVGDEGEPSYTLDRTGGQSVAYPIQGTIIGRSDTAGPQGKGFGEAEEPMYTIDTVGGNAVGVVGTLQARDYKGVGNQYVQEGKLVPSESVVRRLTPRECERLQGFPDDWTASQSDSQRYKQMGNAVAVPVVQWVIDRLVEVHNRGNNSNN